MNSLTFLKGEPPIGWKNLTSYPILYDFPSDKIDYDVSISIEYFGKSSVIVQANIFNKTSKPIYISSIRWSYPLFYGATPTLTLVPDSQPFYYSTENFRGDFFPVGSNIGDRYIKPYPNETVEIGWSEDHIFPGIFIGCKIKNYGLFCASASQEKFFLIFRLRGGTSKDTKGFEIEEYPSGVKYICIEPYGKLEGEKIFFSILKSYDPQEATKNYYKYLNLTGIFERAKKYNPLSKQRIWCSWNYDFFDNITEKDCLKQIPILKKFLPSVKFLQIDDGYQNVIQNSDGNFQRLQFDFLYKNDNPFNPVKFPSGPERFVKKCKKKGIRPAIWLGLWATTNGKMLSEHPHWILCSDTGKPISIYSKSYGSVSILDPSVIEVRDYIEFVCENVFKKWGFEGVKLDFSSFAFESKRILYRYSDETSIMLRKKILNIFRKYLPEDGFFGWCVVAGTGNPFLIPADYFRNAEDIGEGSWEKVKRIALWSINTNILMPERPIFPNIDSVGYSRHLNKNELKTWFTLCAITGYAIEVSGDLTLLNEKQLYLLKKTIEISNPYNKFKCIDLPYEKIENLPSFWVSKFKNKLMIGIFNWNENVMEISFNKSPLKDLVQGKKSGFSYFEEKNIDLSHIKIPPHGSILLLI